MQDSVNPAAKASKRAPTRYLSTFGSMDAADLVVVGAGPAGSAAAITAVEHGRSVVMLDKARFPRDKTCGDGLTANAMRLLQQLGLTRADFEATAPATVRETVLVSPSRAASRPPDTQTNGCARPSWSGGSLDAALVDLAHRRGIDVPRGAARSNTITSTTTA